jgi:hypothetical protein
MQNTLRGVAIAIGVLLCAVATGCTELGPATASRNPSPTATSPGAQGVCRLPVSIGSVSGGWIDYPSGSFVEDPTAGGYLDSGVLKTKAQPVLVSASGTYEFAYSRTLKRWLPSPFPLVSPDGTAYLWTEYETDKPVTLSTKRGNVNWDLTRVHLTQARSGADRVLFQDSLYQAISLTATAAYVTEDVYGGLARLDLATRQLHKLVEGKFEWVVNGAYAWATDSGDRQQYDTLYRADLATGTIQPFFSQPGALAVMINGIDATGSLLVEVRRQPAGVFTVDHWLVSAQGSRLLTNNPPMLANVWIVDSEGVWLAGAERGVYVWKGDQVTPVPGVSSSRPMVPAGVCAP